MYIFSIASDSSVAVGMLDEELSDTTVELFVASVNALVCVVAPALALLGVVVVCASAFSASATLVELVPAEDAAASVEVAVSVVVGVAA